MKGAFVKGQEANSMFRFLLALVVMLEMVFIAGDDIAVLGMVEGQGIWRRMCSGLCLNMQSLTNLTF